MSDKSQLSSPLLRQGDDSGSESEASPQLKSSTNWDGSSFTLRKQKKKKVKKIKVSDHKIANEFTPK